MHYRSNELKFQTSKDVKRELEKLNGTYSENLDMYKVIKDSTESVRKKNNLLKTIMIYQMIILTQVYIKF